MQQYREFHQLFEEYLQQNPVKGTPPELYDPVNYVLALGGKRMRPLLTLVGYDLFGTDVKDALQLAFAMELFHNFTLVHDDIMDNAPLRRGQPTVHIKFNANKAILSGDVMQVYVYENLRTAPDKYFRKLLEVFNNTAIKVCEGQQMDMNYEQQEQVSTDEYLQMIAYKTGVLLGCCLQCGAILGGASEAESIKMYAYGLNMGIAFQIQDDLLDTFGGEEFGKEIGGDIRQNKKTLLLIKALELAEGDDAETLKYQVYHQTNSDEKVAAVTALYEQLGVRELAEDTMRFYQDKALFIMDTVAADAQKKQALNDYALALLTRQV
jgi:geranylgeranyl diphosphate synthase type II